MSRSTLSRTRCLRLIPRRLEKGVFVAPLGPSWVVLGGSWAVLSGSWVALGWFLGGS